MSSEVLICGWVSMQWHAIDDAVLVCDNVFADVVADGRSANALRKAVQLKNLKVGIRHCAYYKKAWQISIITNNDKCLFYSE